MQAAGTFFDANGYDSYDNSGYGSGSPTSDRTNSVNWKHAPPAMSGRFDDFNFGTALDDGHAIVPSSDHDAVGRHLLYETALLDTHAYEILPIDEVDALKKEHERLDSRIDALTHKLTLERKVKDAAQNLQRLYSPKKEARPDTPQSPESPKKSRNSLLGSRARHGSSASQTADRVDDEFLLSVKKVDELNESIKDLLGKQLDIERRLLRHTAAVLADQASRSAEQADDTLTNSYHHVHGNESMQMFNEFDGIRDILHGKPANSTRGAADSQKVQAEHEEQLANMQTRLEQLNSQLRGIIKEASRSRGHDLEPEPAFGDSDDVAAQLENVFARLESNVDVIERERLGTGAPADDLESHLQSLNSQLHSALVTSSETEVVQSLPEPPQATGHGQEDQLRYLEDSLLTLEQVLQQHSQELQTARDAPAGAEEAESRAAALAQKASEYETVLSGLWDLMDPDAVQTSHDNLDPSAHSPLKEDFSLQAFNSRVQHLNHVARSAREQQDILRRQIQQQRELNGKSDVEKDREISEWQSRHDELQATHGSVQEQLVEATTAHAQAEREASESRSELMNVMNELDALKRTIDTRTQEIATARTHATDLQRQLREMEEQMDGHEQLREDKEAAERRHEDLESEVARLRTELTIAQAELDGAYGTRAQRQKEAGFQASEVEALKANHLQASQQLSQEAERTKTLEKELQEMTNEFQEMMRESMELDKERTQLEGLIDGLRDRCDTLETQLNDEKVRWMGSKSPGAGVEQGVREATSVMVLRQEFKKMMRESRAEGMRLIRAEQEERRKLEAEIRRLRQANGPINRNLSAHSATLAPGPPRPTTPFGLTPASAATHV